MKSKTAYIALTLVSVIVLALINISGMSNAAPPPAPMPPTSFDFASGGGSGGGGGGGGGYSPPAFEPYTKELKSTDNTTIGNITGKSFTLAAVWAEKAFVIDNMTSTIRFTADMDSSPSQPKLDITPLSTGNISMPLDRDTFRPVLAFNLTRYSSGGDWPMKSGTVRLFLSVPLETLSGTDLNLTYYLVRSDGKGFILYEAVPAVSNGKAGFDVLLRYENNAPEKSGVFMLAGTRSQAPVEATITPTPTAVPTATPTPKSGNAFVGLIGLIAALSIAAVLYSRGKKV